MTDAEIDALVPLPQPGINTASHSHLRVVGYPAEQVLAHTRAAVRAALRARLDEPVAATVLVSRTVLGEPIKAKTYVAPSLRVMLDNPDSELLTHAQVREAAQAELATWEQSAPGGPTAYEVTHSICRRLGVELAAPKGGA